MRTSLSWLLQLYRLSASRYFISGALLSVGTSAPVLQAGVSAEPGPVSLQAAAPRMASAVFPY